MSYTPRQPFNSLHSMLRYLPCGVVMVFTRLALIKTVKAMRK
jgi:hypothetical protein